MGDVVPGLVILRFYSGSNPSPETVQLAPAQVGITAVDSVLAAIPTCVLHPFFSDRHPSPSSAREALERTFVLRFSEEVNPEEVVTALAGLPELEDVRVDRFVDASYCGTVRHIPSDSEFSAGEQWSLDSQSDDRRDIDGPEAWAIERGDASVIIGITDSGTMVDTTSGEPWILHSDIETYFNLAEDLFPQGALGYHDVNLDDSLGDTDSEYDNVIGKNFTAPATWGTPFEKAVWSSVPTNAILADPASKNDPWGIQYYYTHGLNVASIAASKEGGIPSICGVAPRSRVYHVRLSFTPNASEPFDPENPDFLASPALDALVIRHAAEHASVINMSWGYHTPSENDLLLLQNAIRVASDPVSVGGYDCVLIAAVGNISESPHSQVWYPARFGEVLGVGNMTKDLELYYDSAYGPSIGDVSVVAPVDNGVPVESHSQCGPDTALGGFPCPLEEEIKLFNGTSAASPHAAGLAALLRSRFPALDQQQVRDRITRSAEWYWSTSSQDTLKFGNGKINAYRALTEWGSITSNTTWSAADTRDGAFYVSGDLTIEAGVTLTIGPGVVVKIAPDHEQSGADQSRVQIVVNGGLVVNGTPENPVVFESFTDSNQTSGDWIGIKFESSSTGTLSNVVIRNATRAIENHSYISLTNCTISGCGMAIDAHDSLTASGSLIANNADSFTAVDVHAGSSSFTKCTFANNTGSALAVRGSSTPIIDKCVIAFNGGPAVRVVSGWTGSATMQNSVLFGNTVVSGSLTDAGWQAAGQAVWNENPAFCNEESGDYTLYAFSPAARGPHFGERVGALPVACVPDATVTTTTLVQGCPAGDASTLVVTVDMDEAVMTRNVGSSEIRLDVRDLAAKVFDADSLIAAGAPASAPNYSTTIEHSLFGYYCIDNSVDILLNGYPLETTATVNIRTMDSVAPYGTITAADWAKFGAHYQSPPKPYDPAVDIHGDGTVTAGDFTFFGAHAAHNSPHGTVNAPAQLAQSSATVTFQFTEEYPSATTHRLYVDVDVEHFADVTASMFSVLPGNDRVTFSEWQSAESAIGEVHVIPVERDGAPQVFFGVLVSGTFAGTTAHLGRLAFDVTGTDPIEISEHDFTLSVAEVLVETGSEAPVTAQMGSSVDRGLLPTVARVYHNRLEQNFPNPFNPTTTLAFSLKDPGDVRLTIYDVAGRRVRELVNERRERGVYLEVWDGRNDHGAPVSSGVYFQKLVAGSFTATRKMVLLR